LFLGRSERDQRAQRLGITRTAAARPVDGGGPQFFARLSVSARMYWPKISEAAAG
jgi:hypothetical protein